MIESQANRVFVRSKYDKGYFYRNQQAMDEEIGKYGKLLSMPIYKCNELQSINTRCLSYRQKKAVKQTFEELTQYINETI